MDLVKVIYDLSNQLPKNEFNLRSQIQRAAVSIPSNIAEGKNKKSGADFLRFLRISQGSGAELETQLLIIHSVYPNITIDAALELTIYVCKMLTRLILHIRKTLPRH